MYYKSLNIAPKAIADRFSSRLVWAAKAAAYLLAYFFQLRAALDNKLYPAIITDRSSGTILSINLPAFELLAIDAVGLHVFDFGIDREAYKRIEQQLQAGENRQESRQTLLLHSADGNSMECRVEAEVALGYSGWLILCLQVSHHPQLCF